MKMPKFELTVKALALWAFYLFIQAVRYSLAALVISIIFVCKAIFGGLGAANAGASAYYSRDPWEDPFDEHYGDPFANPLNAHDQGEYDGAYGGKTDSYMFSAEAAQTNHFIAFTNDPYNIYGGDDDIC